MSTAVKRSSDHDAIAIKRVLSSAVKSSLKAGLTKTALARKLATSRPAIDRVLDPRNTSITLRTFVRTAGHVGYRVRLTLEPKIETIARVPAPRSSARLMKKLREVLDRIPAAEVLRQEIKDEANSDYALAVARLRGDRSKTTIQAECGPSLLTSETAERLGCSPEHVRDRIDRGELIGYPALGGRKRMLLPLWQFQAKNSVHDWTPLLIAAYGENGWSLLHFVTAPRTNLGGKSYLELLQTGRVREVIDAAGRSNPE